MQKHLALSFIWFSFLFLNDCFHQDTRKAQLWYLSLYQEQVRNEKNLETQPWLVLFDIFKGLERHPSHIHTTFDGFLSPPAHKNSCNSLYYGTTAIQRSCFLSRPLLFEKQPVFLLQPHHKTYSLHDPCLQMPLGTRAKDGCATRLHILSDSISLENGPSRIQKKMLLVENTM